MRIVFKAIFVVYLMTGTGLWAANKSGTIVNAETWSGTITLTGDVTITGGPVTIQPGCTVSGNPRISTS